MPAVVCHIYSCADATKTRALHEWIRLLSLTLHNVVASNDITRVATIKSTGSKPQEEMVRPVRPTPFDHHPPDSIGSDILGSNLLYSYCCILPCSSNTVQLRNINQLQQIHLR